ncbi:hypothetical protein M9H77_13593 [Catharanthus roseus]|uniref:Uncharacterized protein n=1 Tax=Catharanthus roseus TaxID=4058 RepID=A0ACC0BKU8_CATRO|nr:hypothetical protein M9H77_13593 [Catharanthus roseus]
MFSKLTIKYLLLLERGAYMEGLAQLVFTWIVHHALRWVGCLVESQEGLETKVGLRADLVGALRICSLVWPVIWRVRLLWKSSARMIDSGQIKAQHFTMSKQPMDKYIIKLNKLGPFTSNNVVDSAIEDITSKRPRIEKEFSEDDIIGDPRLHSPTNSFPVDIRNKMKLND